MIVFEKWYPCPHTQFKWDYLIDDNYDTEFSLSFQIWALGNGNWEGYDTYTNRMYWKESLIYGI